MLRAAGVAGALCRSVSRAARLRLPAGRRFARSRSAPRRSATPRPNAAHRGARAAQEPQADLERRRDLHRRRSGRETKGYFDKHNLDVELVNFGGSTDQLLEAIATGKADAGVGMALRWLKPLEQGFDVHITTAIHGGCMRLLASKASGITTLADLKGKTVGVSDMAAPDKNFFSIRLAKLGIDPNEDVEWRVYPGRLLPVALQKGEVQAFPWAIRSAGSARPDGLTEVATNLDGEYAHAPAVSSACAAA